MTKRRPMRVPFLPAIAFVTAAVITVSCVTDPGTEPDSATPPPDSVGSTPVSVALSPELPHDVFAPIPGATGFQAPMDSMSWQMFVALNWPASPTENGVPNRNWVIGGQPVGGYYPNGMPSSPTVWESYKDSADVFLPGAAKPKPFSEPTRHVLYDYLQAFTDSPVIDQNGEYVYYEVRMNEVEFDFILENQLYDSRKQPSQIVFPAGSNTTTEVGSVHVKAAWKIMGGPGSRQPDDPSRFYTSQATVIRPGTMPGTTRADVLTVGLVGLHIAHKTESRPQWIWSTFEHVDNCPDLPSDGESVPSASGRQYSFYDPNCSIEDCPPNQKPEKGSDKPVQVMRVTPITQGAKSLNQEWQNALRQWNSKSAWQYYELISTQWPADPADTRANGHPQPTFLANTVLETYFQGEAHKAPPHSCIDCHAYAVGKDFDFQLGKAYPRQKTTVPGFFIPERPRQ